MALTCTMNSGDGGGSVVVPGGRSDGLPGGGMVDRMRSAKVVPVASSVAANSSWNDGEVRLDILYSSDTLASNCGCSGAL
jgi:hypothetical protein